MDQETKDVSIALAQLTSRLVIRLGALESVLTQETDIPLEALEKAGKLGAHNVQGEIAWIGSPQYDADFPNRLSATLSKL